MEYQKYIDLGFIRTEMNDSVEFKQTGYSGFSLEKELNDKLTVCVCSGNLDKPKLYIKKIYEDNYHIIAITGEMVIDLFAEEQGIDYMANVC